MLSGKLLLDCLSEYSLISHLVRQSSPEEAAWAAGEILGREVQPSSGLFELYRRIDEYDEAYRRLSGKERDGFVNLMRYRLVPFEEFRINVVPARLRGPEEPSLPLEKEQKKRGEKPKRAIAVAPYERAFSNVELIKDSGLIPYLLHRDHGMEVAMVSGPGGPYSYAPLVKGLDFVFLPDGSIEAKADYLKEHGSEIDLLILRGCYSSCFILAPLYKQINPGGRIYIGLDANSQWMDRFVFYEPSFRAFLDACDIIATSCTAMAEHLSIKWGRQIHCLPNGYYDFYHASEPSLSRKEDIILTVGRLGTWQKATEVLLNAFACAAPYLAGDYRLRLVGSMEKEFSGRLEEIFKEFPLLKERIELTGPIEDRQALHREFDRARIFALPSRLEGGAPNVVGEALNSGCGIAVTKIDAWEDITAKGSCGLASPIDDVGAFAENLVRLSKMDPKALMRKALEQGRNFYSMEKQVEALYDML